MVLLISFYPAWGLESDISLYVRVVPSCLAVMAILESACGYMYIDANQSSYVLTVMYGNIKIISIYILCHGAGRLLLGEDSTDAGSIMGLSLLFLQVIKVASACTAAAQYLKGKDDEDMPSFHCNELCMCCPHA